MADDDNIIQFKPIAASSFPRVQRHRPARKCDHRQFEIDERERTVECRACREKVDPVLALLTICRDWEHIKVEAQMAEHEAARLNEIVEERKKARAKVSRARESRADCIELDEALVKHWTEAGAAKVGEAVLSRLRDGKWTSMSPPTMLLIEVKKTPKVQA